jgi:hypothetical protein
MREVGSDKVERVGGRGGERGVVVKAGRGSDRVEI